VDINNMRDLEAIARELDQRPAGSDSTTYVGVAVVAVNGPSAEFADVKICRAKPSLGTTTTVTFDDVKPNSNATLTNRALAFIRGAHVQLQTGVQQQPQPSVAAASAMRLDGPPAEAFAINDLLLAHRSPRSSRRG
jgi:hypothetical protein